MGKNHIEKKKKCIVKKSFRVYLLNNNFQNFLKQEEKETISGPTVYEMDSKWLKNVHGRVNDGTSLLLLTH